MIGWLLLSILIGMVLAVGLLLAWEKISARWH
jgi:hypothetical protein